MTGRFGNYAEARSQIRTGDLIAVRSTHGGFAALVRWVTKSPYTHTAVALWVCDRLMMVETRILAGIVPMSQLGDKDFDVIRCPVADPEYVVIEAFNILGLPGIAAPCEVVAAAGPVAIEVRHGG